MRTMLLTTARLLACGAVVSSCATPPDPGEVDARALRLAWETIVLDGHVDLPIRLSGAPEDVSVRTASGDFDYVRAREGGLDAPFMSIYVPAAFEAEPGKSYAFANELIDLVEGLAQDHPDKFVQVRTADEVRAAFASGRIGLLMGMENGSPIEGDLSKLDALAARGIGYVTLCHSRDNHICDSSYDERDTPRGLTEFGREVVVRMNELGVLVDVSHISDDAFWEVMEVTRAPAIASHSSLRHFVPGFERNMSDAMVERLAENGGVVQINFGSTFVTAAANAHGSERRAAITAFMNEHDLPRDHEDTVAFVADWDSAHPFPRADVRDVADHIDRVVELAGVEHVGFGSDFDGVGDSLPDGLRDASMYPNLIAELLRRGYSESDIEKIASGNVLRVMDEARRVARELTEAR